MSETNPGPAHTAVASGAIAIGARIKITAVASNGRYTAAVAGAGERSHGVALQTVASGERFAFEMQPGDKEVTVLAAGAYSALDDVYGAASGKVSTSVSGAKCYQLMEASSGDGAQVRARWIGFEA